MVHKLEFCCGVPAVIAISNFTKIKNQIFTFSKRSFDFSPEYYQEWKFNLQDVVTKVLKNFNSVLEKKIPRNLIPLIGIEMLKYALFLEDKFGLERKFIENFITCSIFTSKGLIDEVKGARDLIKEQELSSLVRYEIACYYFLEDLIPPLWQQIRDNESFKETLRGSSHTNPVLSWSQYLENRMISPAYVPKLKNVKLLIHKALSYGITNDNSESIKYYFKTLKLFDFRETDENVSSFSIYLKRTSEYFNKRDLFPRYLILSKKFGVFRNVLIFLLETEEQDKMASIFSQNAIAYTFFKGILVWPFQDLFIKMLNSIFFYQLNNVELYRLLNHIVDLIDDQIFCQTYNYRLLFRQFWTESQPDFQRYVLDVESDVEEYDLSLLNPISKYNSNSRLKLLIPKLLLLDKFTSYDYETFRLILEEASSERRNSIAELHAKSPYECIFKLLTSKKIKLLDTFINYLILDEDKNNFKKNLIIFFSDFLSIEQNLELAKRFIEWVVDPSEIDVVKQEIFVEQFQLSNIADLFCCFNVSISYMDKLLIWLSDSDDTITEFKKNADFDEEFSEFLITCGKKAYRRVKKIWKWLEYSSDEIILKKTEMLRDCFPFIVKRLFKKSLDENIILGILYMCSYKIEKVNEFIDYFQVWYMQKIEENECIICLYEGLEGEVYFDNSESEFYCRSHQRLNLLSKKTFYIFSSQLLKKCNEIISSRKSIRELCRI